MVLLLGEPLLAQAGQHRYLPRVTPVRIAPPELLNLYRRVTPVRIAPPELLNLYPRVTPVRIAPPELLIMYIIKEVRKDNSCVTTEVTPLEVR